ncbi:MAG: acylphosphatase [Patescibacteria group bacterium]
MQQAHIFITGKVQGVGFRQFILKQARKRGLTGWVQNLPARNATHSVAGGPDGKVEAVIQGERKLIEELLVDAKKGPFLSRVHTIETKWEELMTFMPTFTIKHPQ